MDETAGIEPAAVAKQGGALGKQQKLAQPKSGGKKTGVDDGQAKLLKELAASSVNQQKSRKKSAGKVLASDSSSGMTADESSPATARSLQPTAGKSAKGPVGKNTEAQSAESVKVRKPIARRLYPKKNEQELSGKETLDFDPQNTNSGVSAVVSGGKQADPVEYLELAGSPESRQSTELAQYQEFTESDPESNTSGLGSNGSESIEPGPEANESEANGSEAYCQNGHRLKHNLFCMFCGLSERTGAVQRRIRETGLSVDETLLSKALVSSRQELESEWLKKRTLFPDSENEQILVLLERKNLTDEDLIILLSANAGNFVLAEAVVENAKKLAASVNGRKSPSDKSLSSSVSVNNSPASKSKALNFDKNSAAELLNFSRAEIYELIDRRISDFSRCGIELIDNWADSYRLEKTLPLEQCLVLLAVPQESWLHLPRQEYIAEILKFGERRIMAAINQGPLVYLRLSRNSSNVDILELGSPKQSAEKILDLLLDNSAAEIPIDPEAFELNSGLERRIRNLAQKTAVFRRDTGKHSLFLGFPFIVKRSSTFDENKTKLRIAPVLLLPVKIDAQIGCKGKVTLCGNSDSDELRMNPALASILELSPQEEEKWKEALEEIASRQAINAAEILYILSRLCGTLDDCLVGIPQKEEITEVDTARLSYSAALFHSDFSGKAVADDLQNICDLPISGTALELALRVAPEESDADTRAETGADAEADADVDVDVDARTKIDRLGGDYSGKRTGETAATSGKVKVSQPDSKFDPEDYGVIAADPSQEIAVQQSRLKGGLHIEGPPGTGKSQTIVNIIADCVARNETVLVVCQKQAALNVVEKRLKAEGLGKRLFYVSDVSKDRQAIVRALREQLDEREAGHSSALKQLRKERTNLVARLQGLDSELNKHHLAFHEVHEAIGLSYRTILSELIQIESIESAELAASPPKTPIKLPGLRALLRGFDNARVASLVEECASVANLWLESKYEVSPLQDLKEFSPDHADAQYIVDEFMRYMKAEEERFRTLDEYPKSAEVDDISVYVNWLKENEDYIRAIPKQVRLNLSKWVAYFFPNESSNNSAGNEAINSLVQVSDALSRLDKNDHSWRFFAFLSALKTEALNKKIAIARSALARNGFVNKWNPANALCRFLMRKELRSLKTPANENTVSEFLQAALLERELRPHRHLVQKICKTLGLESMENQALDIQKLQNLVSIILTQLGPVAELSSKLRSCPLADDAKEFARKAEPAAFDEFSSVLRGVIKRHAVKTESLNRLSRLSDYFNDEWIQAQKRVITAARGNIEATRHIQRYLHTIVPFQEFRLRARSLSPEAVEVFSSLRLYESELLKSAEGMYATAAEPVYKTSADWSGLTLPWPQTDFAPATSSAPMQHAASFMAPAAAGTNFNHDLAARIRRSIRREACLLWKSMLETSEPVLTVGKEEINYKVKSLAECDELLRKMNRKILSEPAPDAVISPQKKWVDITRLSGARARRLRELITNGAELGLMHLRPIWLMNPETASRLLPLKAGLFDVVIFDEASQLLVEYALPTLFRAKRAIVSGDEKQMPPPNFFAARLQNDESISLDEDELDDLVPQAERDRIKDAWNRREIKDCPDLLNLASTVLPSRALQIHYRSQYRELIAFSNFAFYSATLSVPSKSPSAEVRKVRPIEVINVNSVYEKQVNRGEALKVAELLRKIWSVPAAQRPSVGVVSFNLKQADLISEVLQDMALKDARFKEAFEEEARRTHDGEDVGFFVKNLESVQGDERDLIIFSTTFGYDSAGVFRRSFGKLGQEGGERRLNVAITRAKSKVILVTSLPTEKISDYLGRSGNPIIPRDYVQAYLDYATKISNGALETAEKCLKRLSASDSSQIDFDLNHEDPFVQDVAEYVRSLGYEAITRKNDSKDAFDIDITVEDPESGLFAIGIECDAPDHHLLARAKDREIWRPSVLTKSLNRVYRISSRDWYQRKAREKELLRDAIKESMSLR